LCFDYFLSLYVPFALILHLFVDSQVEYLCQKYEALQKQLASVERNCTEQVQRQELLQRELRSLRDEQPQVT
jgi:phage shock protein A